MLSVMWDNGPHTLWGHDPDLCTSRDVIGHVAIRLPNPHTPFLYSCSIVTKPLSAALFEIFDPKIPCAHTDRHTPQSDFIFCPMQGIALDRQLCGCVEPPARIHPQNVISSDNLKQFLFSEAFNIVCDRSWSHWRCNALTVFLYNGVLTINFRYDDDSWSTCAGQQNAITIPTGRIK